MIGLLPTTTIFLVTAPTDLRKAYDGLTALVRQSLGQDPLSGSLYVFCNRRRDWIKIRPAPDQPAAKTVSSLVVSKYSG
jgi:transposase